MSQSDEAQWDAFVERHPCGDLVQTGAWAEAKRAIGQQCSLSVVRSGAQIFGGAMLVTRRVAPGIKVGYSARGPLVEPGEDPRRAIETVVQSARANGVLLLLLQAAPGDHAMDEALASCGFEAGCPSVAPEATIRLDLTKTEDELLAAMTEMRRRNIRKALRSELEVQADDDVETFQRLHTSTAQRQGFVAIDIPSLRAQWKHLAPSGRGRILLARNKGVPVAGIWLTSFAGVVTFKLAGWDATADGSRNANEALHWSAIRWAREIGAHSYDLGGFDRTSAETLNGGGTLNEAFTKTPGFFKLGFGGSPILLPLARWSYLGPVRSFVKRPIQSALASPQFRKLAGRLRNG
jgi:lipid II:glycine glycyltransferase (peptidoglycan interpeptide bridge formation enzyme)